MKTLEQLTEQIMGYTKLEDPTNVLSLLRENIDVLDDLSNHLIQQDAQCKAWEGRSQLKVIAYCFSEDKTEIPFIANWEPDFAIFSYLYKRDKDYKIIPPTGKEIMETLATILLSDCTGCCNALDVISISKDGIFAQGFVGQTYHS